MQTKADILNEVRAGLSAQRERAENEAKASRRTLAEMLIGKWDPDAFDPASFLCAAAKLTAAHGRQTALRDVNRMVVDMMVAE